MEAKKAWLIGRRVPIDSALPWYVAWIMRKIWQKYRWALDVGDGQGLSHIQQQGIVTDENLAHRLANRSGWYCMALPVNAMLPEETITFEGAQFPASSAAKLYEEEPGLMISGKQKVNLEQQMDRLAETIRSARAHL